MKHPHYHKDVSSYDAIDVYDVLALFEVKSHPVGHAIKKLLMAGRRGAKDYRQDLQEAVDSILREIDMQTPPEPEKRATVVSAPWLAQDADGKWFWHELKQISHGPFFICKDAVRAKLAALGTPNPNWKSTLQQRPESKK